MNEQTTTSMALSVGSDAVSNIASPGKFAQMLSVAKTLADSTLVPIEFQNNPSNCLIAVNMALRLRADMFEIAQNIRIIHGRPTMAARWQIAQVNASGRYKEGLEFKFCGETIGDLTCTCFATRADSGTRLEGPMASYKQAQAMGWATRKGSVWPSMPKLMLMYRSATFFISEHCPELVLGFRDTELALDVGPIDITDAPGAGHEIVSGETFQETFEQMREEAAHDEAAQESQQQDEHPPGQDLPHATSAKFGFEPDAVGTVFNSREHRIKDGKPYRNEHGLFEPKRRRGPRKGAAPITVAQDSAPPQQAQSDEAIAQREREQHTEDSARAEEFSREEQDSAQAGPDDLDGWNFE